MAVQYTVREISTSSITVDYADGSWAIVPINHMMTKKDIEDRIGDFQPLASQFNSVDDIPFTIGETGEALSYAEKELKRIQEEQQKIEEEKNTPLPYTYFREQNYPTIGDQLDALYWARKGNDTILQSIDEEIEKVKTQFPKDMTPITAAEYDAIIMEVVEDVLG